MTTDWETNFTAVVLPIVVVILAKNNFGNILVYNHAVIFTEISSHHNFFSVGNFCVDNGSFQEQFTEGEKCHKSK